jgi:GT2 family glycosyltransferase
MTLNRPAMSLRTIAAVVLNWNQSRMTLDCVASLRTQTTPVDRIVVVDNGSKPDQWAVLADGLPAGVEVVRLAVNTGFAGGMNAGIAAAARAGAGAVWLVNNDAFPDPDCLTALVAALDADPTLAAVTPRLVGTDGEEQPAGGRFDATRGANEFLYATDLAEPVGAGGYWAVGTIPLFRADALAKAGGFDDRFFAYWEEVDLCLRLGRMGYRFRSVPQVQALHIGQVSSGGSPFGFYLYVRNWLRLLRRHVPRRTRGRLAVGFTRRILDNAGCFAAHGQDAKAHAAVQAVVASVLGETGKPRWLGRCPRAARYVAARPWKLVHALGWVERRLTPAGGVA